MTSDNLNILMASTECYPVAKVGGMADVVGALPKYLDPSGTKASVIIPSYGFPWEHQGSGELIYEGQIYLSGYERSFGIHRFTETFLGFELLTVSIPRLFDRQKIYLAEDGHGFHDEFERNVCFQRAILQWWRTDPDRFDVVHCHDHMTGLIPFFMKFCEEFSVLSHKPVFFTIHNAAHRGAHSWEQVHLLPMCYTEHAGLLDWDHNIDSLACALRCADRINTVSHGYLTELKEDAHGLEWIFGHEHEKMVGILNGIDTAVWNPETDSFLAYKKSKGIADFKNKNKKHLASSYENPELPLIVFIGRFAHQKGVDVLIESLRIVLGTHIGANFFILGSGDKHLESEARLLADEFGGEVKYESSYNEPLSHQLYAAADFIVMPSRFEPCGLNQLIAMRYGAIPIVHATGGLNDTVEDIDEGGLGLRMQYLSPEALQSTLQRAIILYQDRKRMSRLRNQMLRVDVSWHSAASNYIREYHKMIELFVPPVSVQITD